MRVLKRDGEFQTMSLDKITERLTKLAQPIGAAAGAAG